jgi:hypothetical protein
MTDPLRERFQMLAETCDDSDWQEVRGKAKPRVARPLTLLAVVLLGVIVAAPALGLHRRVVDFFEAEPAPPDARRQFAEMDVGAPRGMAPGVVAGKARRIRLPDGSVLSVAPTKAGGFCSDHGCIRSPRELAAIAERIGDRPGDRDAYRIPVGISAPVAGVGFLEGNVLDSRGETIVVEYGDGTREDVPFVWVGPPINAGFWRMSIRRENQVAGRRPRVVRLLDGDRDELARDRIDDLGPLLPAHPPNLDGS